MKPDSVRTRPSTVTMGAWGQCSVVNSYNCQCAVARSTFATPGPFPWTSSRILYRKAVGPVGLTLPMGEISASVAGALPSLVR